MINVQLSTGSGVKHVLALDSPLAIHELRDRIVEHTGWPSDEFYLIQNGRLANERAVVREDGYITIVPRLLGGKGGFGSMLRAIGAQIEKTTNREACRDLSGRRLRDINEEKRLKAWIEKQSKREEEAADRRKKKLQRLCTEPKHEFKDQSYERERSILTERVGDAVEAGFKVSTSVEPGVKRKHEEDSKQVARKKTILDLDIDSDDLDDSSDSHDSESEEQAVVKNKTKAQVADDRTSHDSGHSSDESGKSTQVTCHEEKSSDDTGTDNLTDEETSRCSKTGEEEQRESTNSTPSIADLAVTPKESSGENQIAKEAITETSAVHQKQ